MQVARGHAARDGGQHLGWAAGWLFDLFSRCLLQILIVFRDFKAATCIVRL